MTARDRWTLVVLSVLGVAANQTLFISGLARTTATNATLLVSTIPVFTLVAGALSGVERPGLRRVVGVPVALLGVLFLLDLGKLRLGDRSLVGDLLIAANSLSYSIYLVAARGILARRSAIAVTAALFRYGTLPILLLALPDLRMFHPSALSGTAALAIAGIVVFATVLAYALNSWALARTDASTTAVFIYIQPLIAGSLAWLVLGERPGPRTFVAAALIFAGVALTTSRRRVVVPAE